MGRLRLFFKSMFSELGSGLSGPASVPFAIASLWVSSHIQRILYGSLAGILLLVSAYRIWARENSRAETAEKKWEDQTPRLGLEVNSSEGENTWLEYNNPFTLYIKLLTGRVPTSVCFDPIHSKCGKFVLKFDALPHIDQPALKALTFDVAEVGAPELSARDREITHAEKKVMLRLFLEDVTECSGETDYPLIARFSDRGESRDQMFHLRWNWGKYRFQRDTT